MPDYVVTRLTLALNRDMRSVNGSRVLLLGLAYKRNTGDTRESPGMVIAQSLSVARRRRPGGRPHLAPGATDLHQVELTATEVRAGRRRGRGDGSRRLRLRHGPGSRAVRARHPEPDPRTAGRAVVTTSHQR